MDVYSKQELQSLVVMGICGSVNSSTSRAEVIEAVPSKSFARNLEFKKLSLNEKKRAIGLKNLQMTNCFEHSYRTMEKSEIQSRHQPCVKYNTAKNSGTMDLVFVATLRVDDCCDVDAKLVELEYFQHLDIYR